MRKPESSQILRLVRALVIVGAVDAKRKAQWRCELQDFAIDFMAPGRCVKSGRGGGGEGSGGGGVGGEWGGGGGVGGEWGEWGVGRSGSGGNVGMVKKWNPGPMGVIGEPQKWKSVFLSVSLTNQKGSTILRNLHIAIHGSQHGNNCSFFDLLVVSQLFLKLVRECVVGWIPLCKLAAAGVGHCSWKTWVALRWCKTAARILELHDMHTIHHGQPSLA